MMTNVVDLRVSREGVKPYPPLTGSMSLASHLFDLYYSATTFTE